MNMRKAKHELGLSILILIILTMSFNISITPLVMNETTAGNIVFEQSSERMTSQERIDTPSMRDIDSSERVTDVSYNYDLFEMDNKEWDVEQPELEQYQSEPLDISFGTPHAPIEITSNDDFDTQGWPGDGSPSTPYVIDDLEITASAAVPGISVTGTDVFFVIGDCVIDGNFEDSKCIVLNAVENALLYNNTCFNGGIGILLNQTDGISVLKNQCFGMTRAGIYLDGSDSNYVWDNLVTDCWDGIYLERSSLNDLQRNLCGGNHWGIDLYWTSNENYVFNNTILGSYDHGITLTLECSLNTIELNYLDSNNNFGIFLDNSDENIIRTNFCLNNGIDIHLLETESNVIDNNTLSFPMGPIGILLVNTTNTLITDNFLITIELAIYITAGSSGIDLIHNNCTHFDVGLTIEDSDDILVQDCYFDSIYNSYCIWADEVTNLDIIDCIFIQTITLIYVEMCDNISITGNTCDDYLMYAIQNIGSNSTIIRNNLCQYGPQAIFAVGSYDLVIHNNTMLGHTSLTTIQVVMAPDVIITDNNCTDNLNAISVENSEGAWIENNFCYLYEEGILVVASNYTTITGNHVQEGFTGIIVGSSFFVDILDNDVINNVEGPTGIHVDDCENCLISGNTLTGNIVPSITIETSPYCEVTHNIITNTIDGIVLDGSNYTIVTDNHITMGQGYGIGVWGSSHCFVSRNHIANISGWEGWAIASSGYDNEFSYNLCDNSTVGIYLGEVLVPHIAHNSANGNEEAIWLTLDCINATVEWNIFEDNTHNGLDDSVNAIIDYNYWSNYTGSDANSDGIGDTPHPIHGTANNNDTHPLVFYPTLPVWLYAPEDRTHEYGHDFEYTLEVVSSTGIAPIAEWWIDDPDFDIANGVITNNVVLGLGQHPVEVRVINIYGHYLSGDFVVTVADTVAPTIVGPDDFSYVVGQTGRMITWIPDDLGPVSYSLSLDGVVVMSGAWNSTAENITYTADGLDLGEHTFVLTVTDIGGHSATDTVVVTVIAGGDVITLLIIIGAGGAIVAVIIIIYLVKKKGAAT